LRILTGYLRPTSGKALVGGVDALEDPVRLRSQIGYVPEEIPLYNHMRVVEFLTFMAELKGLAPARAPAPLRQASRRRLVRALWRWRQAGHGLALAPALHGSG
ncbi:MAG: ABC transporter ATP-binding protein, partial [Deltaproteobacteria bacterium]|nr:ABC transporter ATP-binding protein [Deltaproteobacteria bacterium]